MRPLLAQHPIAGVVAGLVMILWAGWFQGAWEARRRARLAELKDGASEHYFEERRALEAYPGDPRRPWLWGVACGVAILVSSLVMLLG